jgi:catechol 2,3-dioxygenase-like lactoylglutathione lyase family enzyme
MLGSSQLVAFMCTKDAERAKAFYGDTLGLRLVEDAWFALVFDANGTRLIVEKAEDFPVRHGTALGWEVPDIEAKVKELAARGVKFQRYEGMEQDELGIWKAPEGARVAWFLDSDGFTLSLSQSP